jgi:hypothetical protein
VAVVRLIARDIPLRLLASPPAGMTRAFLALPLSIHHRTAPTIDAAPVAFGARARFRVGNRKIIHTVASFQDHAVPRHAVPFQS